MWRSLVEAGVGLEFANSFLVLAGRDEPQAMWPAEQLAAFYTTGRRRRYLTETRVIDRAGGIELVRTRLTPTNDDDRYRQRGYTAPYHDGPTLLELLAEADDESLRAWLRRYAELLERELHDTEEGVPFDLWPDNLIVVGDQLVVADHELVHRGMRHEEVLPRGLLLTALELAHRTPPDRWSAGTVRELVDELSDAAGVERLGSLDPVVERQAECLADIFGGEPGSAAWQTRFVEAGPARAGPRRASGRQCPLGPRRRCRALVTGAARRGGRPGGASGTAGFRGGSREGCAGARGGRSGSQAAC